MWIKPMPDEPYPQKRWNLRHRLTVKRVHKHLTISANGYMYHCMAHSSRQMVGIPDEPASNWYPEHFHYDDEETTHRSPGLVLRYWYNAPCVS